MFSFHKRARYMFSAGILPYAVVEGKIHFLVGMDAREFSLSDFGGRCEKGETPKQTALREFHEETCGAILKPREESLSTCIMALTLSRTPYYMYLLQIPWSPHYPTYFNKIVGFVKHVALQPHKKYCEKSHILWVGVDELHHHKLRSVFRLTFFKNKESILDLIGDTGKKGTL